MPTCSFGQEAMNWVRVELGGGGEKSGPPSVNYFKRNPAGVPQSLQIQCLNCPDYSKARALSQIPVNYYGSHMILLSPGSSFLPLLSSCSLPCTHGCCFIFTLALTQTGKTLAPFPQNNHSHIEMKISIQQHKLFKIE